MQAHLAPHGASATFGDRLEETAKLVERRLEAHLARRGEEGAAARRLEEAMAYGALDGGKRIRPFLLIESARLFGVAPEAALDAACALECVHCYSLIHDDLPAMDDDAVRRGRPSAHLAFDEATAILAGDALLTLAFEILAAPRTHAEAEIRAALALGLAKAAGSRGMAGGQALDLAAEGQRLAAEEIARIQALKTGALFGYACEAGAILGEAAAAERRALAAYGAAVGAAFQLADDLLDLEGDARRLGKATGKDQVMGKATLITVLGADAARARLAALEKKAIAALAPFGEDAATLADAARFAARRAH